MEPFKENGPAGTANSGPGPCSCGQNHALLQAHAGQGKNGGGFGASDGADRPGGLSPAVLGRGFGIRDLCQAIRYDNVCNFSDLVLLANNMSCEYVAPVASHWFRPPTIFSGCVVEMCGWIDTKNATTTSFRERLLAAGFVLFEERSRYIPGVPYGEPVTAGWQPGHPIISEDCLMFANADEAGDFWAAFVQVFQDAADVFTPSTFDYVRYKRQLDDRLEDIKSQLNSAYAPEAVKDAIIAFNGLLREADQLAISSEVEAWYAGRGSDKGAPYMLDAERHESKRRALREEQKRQWLEKVEKLDAEERKAFGSLGTPRFDDEEPPPAESPAGGAGDLPPAPAAGSAGAEAGGLPASGQADAPPAESIGEQIIRAVEPILSRLSHSERLGEVRALADHLRDAVEAERATARHWKPFPLETLPPPLAKFIRCAARSHSVDESFVALPVLAVAGAAMGNAWRLELKDDFLVPPLLWTIIVAQTGSNKSGPFSLAMGPMWQNPPLAAGANPLLAGQQGQYVIDDATSEAVLSRLAECLRGLLLTGEEMAGWLRSFDAYRKGAGGDEQKWIRMWDAKPYRVDRKTSDERVVIQAPAVSIAGAIQPELLSKAADPEKLASGFFARTLTAMAPERKRQWSNVGVDREQVAFWRDLVDTLRTTPFAELDANTATLVPKIVRPSPGALTAWVKWYEKVADRLNATSGMERAITAKADVQAARLGLVIFGVACALEECRWAEPMPERAMAAAVHLAEWFLDETIRVFEATCGAACQQRRTLLLSLVCRLGNRATPRDIQRANSRAYPTAELARDALRDLANAGYGTFNGKVLELGTS